MPSLVRGELSRMFRLICCVVFFQCVYNKQSSLEPEDAIANPITNGLQTLNIANMTSLKYMLQNKDFLSHIVSMDPIALAQTFTLLESLRTTSQNGINDLNRKLKNALDIKVEKQLAHDAAVKLEAQSKEGNVDTKLAWDNAITTHGLLVKENSTRMPILVSEIDVIDRVIALLSVHSKSPTTSPTTSPTASPTTSPTALPTASPTMLPTASPTASPTSGLPNQDGLLAWLRADTDHVNVSGTSVNSVTCSVGSTIQKHGTVKFTVDSVGGAKQGYFQVGPGNDCLQLNAVQTPGIYTVFLTFKTTHTRGPIAGADLGGYGHFDTEVCIGKCGNNFIQKGVNTGEFLMSTHYGGSIKNGVTSEGKTFNDGNWHWVEIYGGTNPSASGNLYSLRFDTGDSYQETNVNDGWMRENVGFFIGRGQGYFGGTAYVKDVLVYNRAVTTDERTVIDGRLNKLIGL